MSLTVRQQQVLQELRKIGRDSLFRYKESSPYLFEQDCKKVQKGDAYCAFGLGGLTYQVAARLELPVGAVLSVFKALERKALVLREMSHPEHHRPRYWWPVGLAAELASELNRATS